MNNTTTKVSLEKLTPNPNNFYVSSDKDKLAMAASVKENGLKVPITVKADNENPGRYIIVSGHLRAEGCRIAGLHEVPVIIEEYETEEEELNALLLGNEYRTKTKYEIAQEMAMRKRIWLKLPGERTDLYSPETEEAKSTRARLAERYKMSEAYVDRYEEILKKRPNLFRAIDEGDMSVDAAYQVVRYADANDLSDLDDQKMQLAIIAKQSPHLVTRVNEGKMPASEAFNYSAKKIAKDKRPKVRKEGEPGNSELEPKSKKDAKPTKDKPKKGTHRCEHEDCPCYDRFVQIVDEDANADENSSETAPIAQTEQAE